MSNPAEKNILSIRLGSQKDQPEIDDLRRRNNPRVLPSLVTERCIDWEDHATLVARLPNGKLAASLLLSIAHTQEELKHQLGAAVPLPDKAKWILTTTHRCSLKSQYLDLLRY